MEKAFWQETQPATTKREQRKQAFREKIMEAAISLFEKNGCDATTLEEICEHADVSRPTFYSYYPSKTDLIKALAEKLWLNSASEFTALFLTESQSTSTEDYVRKFFQMTKKQFEQYDRLERDLIRQSMSDDQGEHSNMNMLDGMTAMFEAVFQQGLERGDVGDRYSIEFLAEMAMAAISTIMMKWAVGESYPIDQRMDEVADFVITFVKLNK